MGQSILRDREAPFQCARLCCAAYRKGIRLIFRNQNAEFLMQTATSNELGDAGKGPGKGYLFSLTAFKKHPRIRLSGERVRRLVELNTSVESGAFLSALENPRER